MKLPSSFASVISPGLCLLLFAATLSARQAGQTTGSSTGVEVVVTVDSKHRGQPAPALEKNDIGVTVGGHKATVVSWTPLKGTDSPIQLYLVMDDSSRMNAVGTHMEELQNFLRSLPPNVSTAVGYMANGRVVPTQDFTTDHAAAAKGIRLPNGSAGSNASPYFALSELARHWPESPGTARRVVLWLTDGIDPYDTSMDTSQDIYMQASVADAQRAGIQVYSIYLAGKGPADRSIFGVGQGQSKLGIVAEDTGAQTYNQGFSTPVSLTPYLDQFKEQLDNQYKLAFEPSGDRTKPALVSLKVTAETGGVNLIAPTKVFLAPH